MSNLTEQIQQAIAWYRANQESMPQARFMLDLYTTVDDPAQFLGKLDADISQWEEHGQMSPLLAQALILNPIRLLMAWASSNQGRSPN